MKQILRKNVIRLLKVKSDQIDAIFSPIFLLWYFSLFFYSALYVCTIYGAPTFFLEVQRLLKLTY